MTGRDGPSPMPELDLLEPNTLEVRERLKEQEGINLGLQVAKQVGRGLNCPACLPVANRCGGLVVIECDEIHDALEYNRHFAVTPSVLQGLLDREDACAVPNLGLEGLTHLIPVVDLFDHRSWRPRRWGHGRAQRP